MIVDKMYSEVPDLMKDAYWNEKHINLPITQATPTFRKVHFAGTTAQMRLVQHLIIIIIIIIICASGGLRH